MVMYIKKIGFSIVEHTKPNAIIIPTKQYHKEYQDNLKPSENMNRFDTHRVWDCGTSILELKC